MIRVDIFSQKNSVVGFSISGHANFKPYGKDIVCAAASILGYTAIKSIVEVCELMEEEILYNVDNDTGLLDLKLLIDDDDSRFNNTQIVLNTFVLGMESLEESYPKYIRVEYREVQ